MQIFYEYKVAAVNRIGQGDWSAAGVRIKVERAREEVVVENNDNGEERKRRRWLRLRREGVREGCVPGAVCSSANLLGGGRGDEGGGGPSTREAASNMSITSNVMLAASASAGG